MFRISFKLKNGLVHHEGNDFPSETEAINYASENLKCFQKYISATITDNFFPILTLEK